VEDIKGMRKITPDGIPKDRYLGFIPTHPRPQPINLQPQKGSQSQEQMTKDGDGFSHLRFLHATALLKRPVVNFYPPSFSLQLLSLSLRHLKVIGRPVFRAPFF